MATMPRLGQMLGVPAWLCELLAPTRFASFLDVFQPDLLSTSVHIRPPRSASSTDSRPGGPGLPVQGAHWSHTELSTGESWQRVDNKGPSSSWRASGPRNQWAWGPHANPGLGETQLGRTAHSFFFSLRQIPSPKV